MSMALPSSLEPTTETLILPQVRKGNLPGTRRVWLGLASGERMLRRLPRDRNDGARARRWRGTTSSLNRFLTATRLGLSGWKSVGRLGRMKAFDEDDDLGRPSLRILPALGLILSLGLTAAIGWNAMFAQTSGRRLANSDTIELALPKGRAGPRVSVAV